MKQKNGLIVVLPPRISVLLALVGICLTLIGSSFNIPILARFGTLSLVAALVGFSVYMIVLFLALPDPRKQPDTRLATYLREFFSDWAIGMSGPLSVPFAAMAVWSTQRIQKLLWGCLAALSFIFASYRVWRKDRAECAVRLEVLKETIARKDVEIASRDQRIQVFTEKPNRTLAEQNDYETAKKALKLVGDKGLTAMRHIRRHGALTFSYGASAGPLPPGLNFNDTVWAYNHCASEGLLTCKEKYGSGEKTFVVAPKMERILDELLYEDGTSAGLTGTGSEQ